jgi:hypothetical protein
VKRFGSWWQPPTPGFAVLDLEREQRIIEEALSDIEVDGVPLRGWTGC